MYNWQHENWAQFIYRENIIDEFVPRFAENFGEINGVLKSFDLSKQQEHLIRIIISEAQKTSEIEGEMTAKKYISIAKTSNATATRDLQHLTEIGALLSQGDGRNVHYLLNI
jgi:Fic family protein